MISKNTRQLNLYYHPEQKLSKKCLALANANKADVLAIDLSKTSISQTDWVDISKILDKPLKELVDFDNNSIDSSLDNDSKLSQHDVLKILENHPEAIVGPIGIKGDKGILATSETDILKLQNPDTGEVRIP